MKVEADREARQKARRIMAVLDRLYPAPEIPLAHADPFTLLVAVVLSAQTTDKKVNQVTPALFAVAGTPEKLAALSVEAIRAIIREVGLAPQKARALAGLAQKLLAEHGGRVPDDFEALLELPGVGRKTANVVMAQAFGRPAFPVDTHIHRLAKRWGLSSGKSPDHTERDLRRAFPESAWNRLHLQIIYFGREHCPALRHEPAACPICAWAAVPEAGAGGRPAGRAARSVKAVRSAMAARSAKAAKKGARRPGKSARPRVCASGRPTARKASATSARARIRER